MNENQAAPRWTRHRQHINQLVEASLAAVDPAEAVSRHLSLVRDQLQVGPHSITLDPEGQVLLVGAGKAGVPMASACRDILGGRLSAGVMAVPQAPSGPSDPINWIVGGHPVPNRGSLRAGRAAQALLNKAGEKDVVLALISGGGSALLEHPVEGISLDALRVTTNLLLDSGADIRELNCVRHQLSQIKGGGLSRMASPAPIAALILSDVIGDRLDIIASGPTVPPGTSPAKALAIVERLRLGDRLPASVMRRLAEAARESSPDTPPSKHVIIASNQVAAQAATALAHELGFNGLLLNAALEGEARHAGTFVASFAKSVRQSGRPATPPACLVFGGETTVKVVGSGKGGRNQELALAASLALEGWERCVVATLATDGVDGPTPAAGAVVDSDTASAGRRAGMDPWRYLDNNDSFAFFSRIGATIQTGPTGTNVNDLTFVIVYE